jgi:hypothetical protein
VHLPGRRFPGLVIQGDSLSILHSALSNAKQAMLDGRLEEAGENIDEALDSVTERLAFYEGTLDAAQMPLPYVHRLTSR